MKVGEKFMYLAYVLAGLIYTLYAWHLARRLRRSRQELSDLKTRLKAAPSSSQPA